MSMLVIDTIYIVLLRNKVSVDCASWMARKILRILSNKEREEQLVEARSFWRDLSRRVVYKSYDVTNEIQLRPLEEIRLWESRYRRFNDFYEHFYRRFKYGREDGDE